MSRSSPPRRSPTPSPTWRADGSASGGGLQDYVDNQAKKTHGHGGHKYQMADYGYAPNQIETAFAEYLSWYEQRRDSVRLQAA